MTELPTNIAQQLHGTYEIDEDGKIRYFFSAFDSSETNRQMVGQSFYDYLKNIPVGSEFEGKIRVFIAGSATTDSFNADYVFEGLKQRVLVLLARIREKSHKGKQDVIVIDIKPEQRPTDLN